MANIDKLFEEAQTLSEAARSDFLESLPDDQRNSVEKLLAADESLQQRDAFLQPPGVQDDGGDATFISSADAANEKTFLSDVGSAEVEEPVSRVGEHVRYFGEYELVEEIARGGMGVVFKARQVSLNRIVALKMILAGNLAGSEEVARFKTEAEAAANLDHPGIVPIYEIGEHNGQHYFSMGFIDGPSLHQEVRNGPLPARDAVKLCQKIANAISYAHQNGVIHRDLKPANVLLDSDNEPKITDFGLAKQIQSDSGLTQTGAVMGTPGYMPPEQASGEMSQVGALADVYSIGAILYCLVTGRPPFQASSAIDTLTQVMNEEPVAPQQLNSGVDADLQTVILKCLEKQPDRRYASADDLSQELTRYLNGEPIHARPVSRLERIWRWGKRKPAMATVCALATILLALLSVGGPLVALQQRDFAQKQIKLKGQATDAKEVAEQRRSEAEAATDEAERQQQRAERLLYGTRISLAHREWFDGNPKRTKQLLSECPVEMRKWEWHYLDGLTRAGDLTIFAHQIPASVEFTPNGKSLLTRGTADKQFNLWDVETGLQKDSVSTPDLRAATLVDDDHLLLVSDEAVICFDLAKTKPKSYGGFGFVALSGHVFANGTKIATAFGDGSIVIYDRESREELHRTPKKLLSRLAHVFSPDAKYVAGVVDTTVRIWSVETGEQLVEIAGHIGHVASVAFSPDGSVLASGGRGAAVILTDVETGQRLRTIRSHDSGLTSVAFSPDGDHIATGSMDRTARIYNVRNGSEMLVVRGHSGPVLDVAFGPNGRRLATAAMDGTVRVWATDRQLMVAPEVQTSLTGASHAGHSIGFESRIFYGHRGMVYDVVVSPDGRFVATAAVGSSLGDQQIQLWSLADSTIQSGFPVTGGLLHTMTWSADSRYLVVASGGAGDAVSPGSVAIWDVEAQEKLQDIEGMSCMLIRPALNQANDILAVAYGNTNYGNIRFYSFPECELLHDIEVTGQRLSSIVFSKTQDVLLSSTHPGGVIQSWDARSGAELDSFVGHGTGVFQIDVSADDQLATANIDGTIGIWDWQKQEQLAELKGHNAYAVDVCFSPDGKRLLSSSEDETVKVWDIESYSELLSFRDHRSPALCADWSSDGRSLATTSRDGTLIVRQLRESGSQELAGAEEEWVTTFEDAFERRALGEDWLSATPSGWAVEEGKLVGTLQPVAKSGASFPGTFISLTTVDLPRTVDISADITPRQPMLAQLVLSNRRSQQYIAPFVASTTQPYGVIGSGVQVARGAGEQTKLLDQRPGIQMNAGTTYRFRVVRAVDSLRFYLDDELLSDSRVPTLEADQLLLSGAFSKVGHQIEFDNIRVQVPQHAIRELEIRKRVNEWLTQALLPDIVRGLIEDEYADNAADRKTALMFLNGLNAMTGVRPDDVIKAIERVAYRSDATTMEYGIAAAQTGYALKLRPDAWWTTAPFSMALMRIGQHEKALNILRLAEKRSDEEAGHVLPTIVAAKALTLHAMGRDDDANATHQELADLCLTKWQDAGLAELREELQAKIPLAEKPLQDELLTAITGSRTAHFHGRNIRKQMSIYATDAEITQGRSEDPDDYDRVYNLDTYTTLEAVLSTSNPQPRVHVIWDDVNFEQTDDQATVELTEILKFSTARNEAYMIFRFGQRYEFQQQDNEWKVARQRTWQIDRKLNDQWTQHNEAHWKELDERIDQLREDEDNASVASACITALRFQEAYDAAQKVDEDESLSQPVRANNLATMGEAAIMIGLFDKGIRALEEAQEADATVQMPWFFTRVHRVYAASKSVPFAMDFHPMKNLMATSHENGSIVLWDTKTQKIVQTIKSAHANVAADLAFFDEGNKLVSAGWDRLVNIFDAETGERLNQLSGHIGVPYRLESHPQRKDVVVTAAADNTARIWDLTAGRELVSLSGHSGHVMTAAFSPDGKQVATGSKDGTIRFWDADTGRELSVLTAHEGGVERIDWTPDGKRVVSAGIDKTVRIWDAIERKKKAAMIGHGNSIDGMRVSPDGKLAASGDYDGRIYVWNLETFKLQAVLRGHNRVIYDLRFHDGYLFSTSKDATIKQWDINFDRSPLRESMQSVAEQDKQE